MVQDVLVKLNLGLPWQKQLSRRRHSHLQIGHTLEEETSKVLHLKHKFYGAETWKFWKADQKCLKSPDMWCWRRMYKISWNDGVRNKQALHRVTKDRNIL